MKKQLKSLIVVLLAVAFLFAIVGCQQGGGGTATDKPVDTATEAPAEPTDAPVDEGEATEAPEETGDETVWDGSAVPQEFKENVSLNIYAFCDDPFSGPDRTDPVTKYLEEKMNVKVAITSCNEQEWPTQLAAFIASNDLPDIFYLSDAAKQIPMLTEAKAILAIEPYLADNAPNLALDPMGQAMIKKRRDYCNGIVGDNQLYVIGLCKGSWDGYHNPTCGRYFRWDLYAKAGYPEMKKHEDIVDALAKMWDFEKETENKQSTYPVGGWFGDVQGWSEWPINSGLANPIGAVTLTESLAALSYGTFDLIEGNMLKEKDSIFWRGVGFYNKANQLGILDPDSFTQNQAAWNEKFDAGRYFYFPHGWVLTNINNKFQTYGWTDKAFVAIPMLADEVAEDRIHMDIAGERLYCIAANTAAPERCVAVLDYVSTYEWSRYSFSGLEGDLWKYDDAGKVVVDKEKFLDPELTAEWKQEHGAKVYHHFMGYRYTDKWPKDGEPVDLYQFSKEALDKVLVPGYQAMLDYYGASDLKDLYTDKAAKPKESVGYNFYGLGDAPAELKTYQANLEAYRWKNVFKIVAAKDDAEFTKLQDDFIAKLGEYKCDELYEYWVTTAKAQQGTFDEYKSILDIQ